uniref:RNase H type-1 domain-containing protein n=1 Tax=Panagrolaimus sp. ES5 TaxID=591445 RepID=A0AC34EZD5_9BILA
MDAEMGEQNTVVAVYTDGSSKPLINKKETRAGAGIYFEHGHHLNRSIELTDKCAGYAEYYAMKKALELIENSEYKDYNINVYTDRADLLRRLDPAIKSRKFKKGSNMASVYQALQEVLHRFKKGQVKFHKVTAHSGNHGNDMADQLAGYSSGKYETIPLGLLHFRNLVHDGFNNDNNNNNDKLDD